VQWIERSTRSFSLSGHVEWVKRSGTHRLPEVRVVVGFAALCPSYALEITMKVKTLITSAVAAVFSALLLSAAVLPADADAATHVRSYKKKSGTHVKSHHRKHHPSRAKSHRHSPRRHR
jgi:hypothetical protein